MKKTVLVVLILVLLTGVAFLAHYYRATKDDTSRLEAAASEFSLLVPGPQGDQYVASFVRRGKPAILITRSWCRRHVDEQKYGFEGTTGMRIRVYLRRDEQEELYKLILKMLDESPKQARWVFEHSDLRVRLLGMAAVVDHLGDSRRIRRVVSSAMDGSHLLEALAVLVGDKDPFLVGAVLATLADQKFFRPTILRDGFAHGCSEVRFECILYADRVLETLDAGELRELIGALIEHIDEHDSVLQGMCYSTLGRAVFELDCRLQGVKKERSSAFNQGVTKLPELPMGWENLATGSWTRAHEVRQMWQEWFESLPEYGDTSGGSEGSL
jgi:hypothetical protein